jgi:hypothetical protein
LGHHPITNIKNRDLRFDAFARMHGWKRYLPGLKNYGHPIADALQVSFWILQLDAETSIRTETPEEKRRRKCEQFLWTEKSLSSPKRGAPGAIMVTTDVGRELLRDIHPDRELLKRFLPPKWRRTKKDDVTAARIVIANSISILHLALKKKKRWHYDADGLHTSDWSIIETILRDRLTVRDVAGLLGLDRSGSDITRRFKAALDTISEVVDPQEILIPANGGAQTSIERRKAGEVLRPVFDAAQRARALEELDKAARKVRPPISHFWATPKLQRWNTSWFSGGIWASRLGAAPELHRWSAAWFYDGIVFTPERERKIDTPYFCGPVIELKNGELRPRAHGGAVHKHDTVARFEHAVTREDDEPFFDEPMPDLT